jgi:hypothetical protein
MGARSARSRWNGTVKTVTRRLACVVVLALLLALAAESSSGANDTSSRRPVSDPTQRPVVVRVNDGGFHWADAGVGAAAAFAATLLAVGLALAVQPECRRNTSRRTFSSARKGSHEI